MRRAFCQVDVFTDTPYAGNPVAVVMDAEGLEVEQMSRFTRWTNLSEATFVLPPTTPEADYRVRIFTGASDTASRTTGTSELPFAGHPTLGTCHAWLEGGGKPHRRDLIVQECAAGLIHLHRVENRLSFATPPLIRSGPVDEPLLSRIATALRVHRREIVDAAWADNGPGWVAVLLRSADAVLALDPRYIDLDLGVAGPHADGSAYTWEVRAFFPRGGTMVEDPVTGSLNGSLAQWLLANGRATLPYTARQGTALGRDGRVYLSVDGQGTIWVGGDTVTCINGLVEL
jgi:PhzF family phenazine biosynthesis protein